MRSVGGVLWLFCAMAIAGPLRAQTAPATAESARRIGNDQFRGGSRPGEYSVDLDGAVKRTADSAPAGHIKSLLTSDPPNDQSPAFWAHKATYDELRGKRVMLSAWLKTSNVEGWCGLEVAFFGKDGTKVSGADT